MVIYLNDRKAMLLMHILKKYTYNEEIATVYREIKIGLENDYGKRVD